MSLSKPYFNMHRPGAIGKSLIHSEEAGNHIVAYSILKQDLKKLFEYIEPSAHNKNAYSHRTFELLLRICTEIESNFKLIFSKNAPSINRRSLNICRYSDLEGPMRLSHYTVECVGFNMGEFTPFVSFRNGDRRSRSPSWYSDFNAVKHNRSHEFNRATLENVIHSCGALFVLLNAQYGKSSLYTPLARFGMTGTGPIPDLFRLTRRPVWGPDERYSFEAHWPAVQEPFARCPIPEIRTTSPRPPVSAQAGPG